MHYTKLWFSQYLFINYKKILSKYWFSLSNRLKCVCWLQYRERFPQSPLQELLWGKAHQLSQFPALPYTNKSISNLDLSVKYSKEIPLSCRGNRDEDSCGLGGKYCRLLYVGKARMYKPSILGCIFHIYLNDVFNDEKLPFKAEQVLTRYG